MSQSEDALVLRNHKAAAQGVGFLELVVGLNDDPKLRQSPATRSQTSSTSKGSFKYCVDPDSLYQPEARLTSWLPISSNGDLNEVKPGCFVIAEVLNEDALKKILVKEVASCPNVTDNPYRLLIQETVKKLRKSGCLHDAQFKVLEVIEEATSWAGLRVDENGNLPQGSSHVIRDLRHSAADRGKILAEYSADYSEKQVVTDDGKQVVEGEGPIPIGTEGMIGIEQHEQFDGIFVELKHQTARIQNSKGTTLLKGPGNGLGKPGRSLVCVEFSAENRVSLTVVDGNKFCLKDPKLLYNINETKFIRYKKEAAVYHYRRYFRRTAVPEHSTQYNPQVVLYNEDTFQHETEPGQYGTQISPHSAESAENVPHDARTELPTNEVTRYNTQLRMEKIDSQDPQVLSNMFPPIVRLILGEIKHIKPFIKHLDELDPLPWKLESSSDSPVRDIDARIVGELETRKIQECLSTPVPNLEMIKPEWLAQIKGAGTCLHDPSVDAARRRRMIVASFI